VKIFTLFLLRIKGVKKMPTVTVKGRGSLTLTDLNDAIVSGTEPSNPTNGTLWVDESVDPNLIKRWQTGTGWVVIGEIMNEGTGTVITSHTTTLGNMADDNIIDITERQYTKDKITEIIGYAQPNATATLPTTATLDSSGKGSFYNSRKSALNAGISSSDTAIWTGTTTYGATYDALVTKYNALKTYLEGLTPVDVWDVSSTNKNTNVTVVKDTWRTNWQDYYQAELNLDNATAKKLQDNIGAINIGGRNYVLNSNFAKVLASWATWGTATTRAVEDVTGNTSITKALHLVLTGSNQGVTQKVYLKTNTDYTLSYDLKVVTGTLGIQLALYNGTTYTYNSSNYKTANTDYTRYSYTFNSGTNTEVSIQVGVGSTALTALEMFISNIKLEQGNKMTAYTTAPEDLEGRVVTVEQATTSDAITSTVTSSATYLRDLTTARLDLTAVKKVRYIRDYVAGNTVNSTNHWVEIKAMAGYTNRALNILPTTNSTASATNLSYITNGDISSATYWAGGVGNISEYVQVDLGAVYDDIEFIQVWHYYSDARTYHGTKTQISEDGTNWTTIFDSSISGEYKETGNGRVTPVNLGLNINSQGINMTNTAEAGLMTINPTFTQWNASNYPYGMSVWGTGNTYGKKETTLTRSGGSALRFNGMTVNDAGAGLASYFKSNIANQKYVTLELDFYVVPIMVNSVEQAQDLSGAGVLIDWTGQASYRSQATLQSMVTDTIVTGKWYSVRKVFKRPSDTTTGYTNMGGYLMANYSSLGTKADKDIVYDRLLVRQSSAEEIKAYESDLSISDMMSDLKVTPIEKETLSREWESIKSQYGQMSAQATALGVSSTAYVNAYTALDGTTPKVATEILSSMTTTYTFSSTTNRDTFKTKWNLYYSESEKLSKAITDKINQNIKDVEIGGKNLILNSTFNSYDKDTGVLDDWTGVNAKWLLKDTPDADKPSSNILTASATLNTTNPIYSVYSNYFYATLGDEFTFTIDLKVTDVTAWDVKAPFIVEFYDATSARVEYHDTYVTDMNATMVNNVWQRISYTYKVTNSTVTKGRIRLALFKNGEIFVREVKVERGNKPTDYTTAEDDMLTTITMLQNDMTLVQQAITADAITSTVMGSTTYSDAMSGYATTGDLGGYATGEQLTGVANSISGIVDGKITALQIGSTYATKSELTQTKTDITAKFSATGGMNLVKNSIGFADFTNWTGSNSSSIQTVSNQALNTLGFGSGFYFPPQSTNSLRSIYQDIPVIPNQPYTMSSYFNKTNVNDSANSDGAVYVQVFDGANTTTNIGQTRLASEYVTTGYEPYQFEVTPTQSIVRVRICAFGYADSTVTGVMFTIGDVALQWSLATGETYNTNVRLDINGIRVSQLDANLKEIGYTQITPDEFAGFYDADGDGNFEKVFYLNGDETVSKKVRALSEISMGSLKMVKVPSSPDWQTTHAYIVNDKISYGKNTYTCTIAGTSGSTPPTHTTGTATDGTVTWSFVSTSAYIGWAYIPVS
jgi:hypothetical protein